MTNQRSFLPGDTVTLVATVDATISRVKQLPVSRDWRDELEAYNNERDIKRLMMNRTGVCG